MYWSSWLLACVHQLHSEPLTIARLSQHLNQPHTKNLSEVSLLQTQATLSLQWETVLRLKFCGILIECNHHYIVNLSIRCKLSRNVTGHPGEAPSSPRCCCFDKLLFLKRIHVELAVGHRRPAPAPPLHCSTPLFVFLVHVRYVKMIDNWREMWRYWTLSWLFIPSRPGTSPCLWTNPSLLKSNHGN